MTKEREQLDQRERESSRGYSVTVDDHRLDQRERTVMVTQRQ